MPLFVYELLNVCVYELPLNNAPLATVKAPLIFQPRFGTIPVALVLLIFRIANVGDDVQLNVGATVPLKFTVPVEVNPEFIAIVCNDVPENVTTPLLVNVPVLE